MKTQSPSQRSAARLCTPWTQRQRIRITDLMQGGREVVFPHEGEEHILPITKTGKRILTA
jgi:hemin uptake protein HemP